MAKRCRFLARETKRCREAVERQVELGCQCPHAALDRIARKVAGEVECHTLAGVPGFRWLVLGMQAAHAGAEPRRGNCQRVADMHRAGKDSAGDHGADAGEGEAAVDGQTEAPCGGGSLRCAGSDSQMREQLGDAGPALRRDMEDWCAGHAGAGQQGQNFSFCGRFAYGVDSIALGQRHGAVADAEQVGNGQMLARLRHRPIVGGDDQQQEVDAGSAGEHVVDQLLVAGHIDEAEHIVSIFAIRQGRIGVAEIKRDAARLLFRQTIGIDAGERLHQRGLAVVDVACGADDHAGASAEEFPFALRYRRVGGNSGLDVREKNPFILRYLRTNGFSGYDRGSFQVLR